MASLIRLAARASHLEIRAPTSIFGWPFHNHQEATVISSRKLHSQPAAQVDHELCSGGGSEQTQRRYTAFSWLTTGLLVLCAHKDDSEDDLDLPVYEDFKFTLEGTILHRMVFTRVYKGEIIEVRFCRDHVIDWLNEDWPWLMFCVDIKSDQHNEKSFACRFKVRNIQDGITEENIYEITSLRLGNGEEVRKEVLEQSYDKCYEYLWRYGITQEFFHFSIHVFLPEYMEQCYAEQSDNLMKILNEKIQL